MYTTSKDMPPPFNSCEYYERSCDPFSPDLIMAAMNGTDIAPKPDTGWLGLDYAENPIGFCPDGTTIESDVPQFEIVPGFYPDGRMFAYPVDKHVQSLKNRHAEYAQQYKNKGTV